MARGDAYIGKADLEFVLGDTNSGAGFVLGQGAAESHAAVHGDMNTSSLAERISAIRTDAEQNDTTDWNRDGTPIHGSRQGHTRGSGKSSRTGAGVAVEPGFEYGGE